MQPTVSRLKRYEEEENPQVLEALAVEVDKKDVKELTKLVSGHKLPKHIKRIKKTSEADRLLVLVSVKESFCEQARRKLEKYELVEVSIPQRMPLTPEQNSYSQSLWPCSFHPPREPEISVSYVGGMLRYLKAEIKILKSSFCAGICVLARGGLVVCTEVDTDNVLGHSVFKSISRVSRKKHAYLCTGFDAFLYKEPCLSCAMAFVHGRVARVFLLHYDSTGPYSSFKLCYNKNLNHRYPVYKIEDHGVPNKTLDGHRNSGEATNVHEALAPSLF